MSDATGIDKETVIAELSPEWLAGLEGAEVEEGRRLLAEIVDDWAREADATSDPAAVHRFQRQDLEALGEGRDAAGRLEALRLRVLGRRVDRLSVGTFALGKAILSGSIDGEEARSRGEAFLRQTEAVAAELKRLDRSPALEAMQRDLGEAVMEALFAVERKATSPRLAREADQAGEPEPQGPPQVRP
ncbi:MAG: hypothetical protein ACXW08_04160 [Solirubrobacteraceae bacterium]